MARIYCDKNCLFTEDAKEEMIRIKAKISTTFEELVRSGWTIHDAACMITYVTEDFFTDSEEETAALDHPTDWE